ncbi:MAG: TolC family protein [Alphaproteobacteria bacterium]|nr:TolC family protein [Alphaproteobacteria bacterium]
MKMVNVIMKSSLYIGVFAVLAFINAPVSALEIEDIHVKMVEDEVSAKVVSQLSTYESKRLASIEKSLKKKASKGSWQQMAERKGKHVSLREAVVRGLEKNLTVSVGKGDRETAKHVIEEAKAAFDPVFTLGISYTQKDTTTRYRTGHVNLKNFQPFAPNYYQDIPTGSKTPALERMGFGSQTFQANVENVIEASTDPAYAPERSYTFSMDLTQVLPNGMQIAVSSATTKQKVYYRDGYYWKNGQYSSDFSFNFYSPLPFTKGYGEFSLNSVYEKQMKIADERAEWELKNTINGVLQQVGSTYWALVQSVENLHSTEKNLKLTSEQRARVLRRFELHRATEYEKAQIEAEYKKTLISLEQARSAYLVASNALGVLIENSDKIMSSTAYLPYGYSDSLEKKTEVSYEQVMEMAKKHRPDYHIAQYNEKIDELALRGSENQALPDVAVSVTLTNEQDGSIYGYKDARKSWGNIFDPDRHKQNYNLSFTRQLGNRAAKAGVSKSFYDLQDRLLSSRDVKKAALEEISGLLSSLDSARVRSKLAKKEKERIQTAYNGLLRKQKIGGDVKQDELILTSRRLLSANLSHISALIENKTTELQLLAAQGILANEFGEQTAVSKLDKKRISYLATKGHLKHFSPLKNKKSQ